MKAHFLHLTDLDQAILLGVIGRMARRAAGGDYLAETGHIEPLQRAYVATANQDDGISLGLLSLSRTKTAIPVVQRVRAWIGVNGEDIALAEAQHTRAPERLLFLAEVMVTAFEGGCTYWARGRNVKHQSYQGCDIDLYGSYEIRWQDEEPYPKGDARNGWHLIDPDAIERGIAKCLEPGFKLNSQITGWIASGSRDNDAGNIDADAADCIVQAACFGEVVFG